MTLRYFSSFNPTVSVDTIGSPARPNRTASAPSTSGAPTTFKIRTPTTNPPVSSPPAPAPIAIWLFKVELLLLVEVQGSAGSGGSLKSGIEGGTTGWPPTGGM